MGFPYPHHDAEFLAGVVGVGLLGAVAFPLAQRLPRSVGIPLALLPLVLLIAWSAWTWHRVRRG
ncbi:hypothetical protein [Paludisphaera sp.]|uniref:hypothetical protein n=1 Tax=Paludisphaera sp. TaxID=2017432 RepID=UPI00301C518D